jgi:hypothetical protein
MLHHTLLVHELYDDSRVARIIMVNYSSLNKAFMSLPEPERLDRVIWHLLDLSIRVCLVHHLKRGINIKPTDNARVHSMKQTHRTSFYVFFCALPTLTDMTKGAIGTSTCRPKLAWNPYDRATQNR